MSSIHGCSLLYDVETDTSSRSILCSEFAVKLIDEPFVKASDNKSEWAL